MPQMFVSSDLGQVSSAWPVSTNYFKYKRVCDLHLAPANVITVNLQQFMILKQPFGKKAGKENTGGGLGFLLLAKAVSLWHPKCLYRTQSLTIH